MGTISIGGVGSNTMPKTLGLYRYLAPELSILINEYQDLNNLRLFNFEHLLIIFNRLQNK
jgi:hypothetical protein